MDDDASDDSWLRFRADLHSLWEAAGSPPLRALEEQSLASGSQPTLTRSTIHSYLAADRNRRVGTDTRLLERLVDHLLQHADGSEPAEVAAWRDTQGWQRRWQALSDRPFARPEPGPPPSAHVSLLGWDGAGDSTVLAGQGAETPWLGHHRLIRLAAMVEGCGQVGLPEAAWKLAAELEHSADRLLPAGSVGVLASRHIAAYWVGEAGQPHVARAKTEEILRACIAVVGSDHALTHLAELRLAHWTARSGDRHAALRLYRIISDRQTNDRMTLLARLARARLDTDAAESATRIRGLLPDLERAFGIRHPVALTARHSIVRADLNAGRITEAQHALPDLRDAFTETFGHEHALTLRLRTTEAGCAHADGRDDAYRLAAAAHTEADRVLGPDHPLTLHAGNVHAIMLADTEPERAQELWTTLISAATLSLGDSHPLVLTLHHNLAITTQHLGDPAAARTVFERIVHTQSDVLGPDAPDTLRTELNLAMAISETDGIEAGLPSLRRIHRRQERVLGPTHPETITSRVLIALGTYAVEESPSGRAWLADELRDLETLLGAKHPVTRQVQQALNATDTQRSVHNPRLMHRLSAFSGAGGGGEEEEEE
ncbi:tetratricopeptide repeat protein [Streptomyces sp. NPDC005820]|uniref:tetratricopeptide repeat protein n=1 Tax=Streptomyces sp. NPDC005820 TaxID=3157069 RepID=UPI0033E345B5